ncbi:MAG TPA: phosphotransferase [Candidatus Lustribacter sp.]|nr:phosphotransferase [Candidatus Lustribacter sp.]
MTGDEEIPLAGGNVSGAVRVGDTVRRPTGPWTPAVHAVLGHLAGRLPHVPEVFGIDERGREILTFLPGEIVDIDSAVLTPGQLASLTGWTRRLHEAVAGFWHDGPWRCFPVEHPSVIGHNDIAPYNACFDGDELVGVFDWDLAGPSTPLDELAFIAWNGVPLWRDVGPQETAARLEIIASAYDGPTAGEILAAVPGRVQIVIDGIPAAAAAGDPGMANLMAIGEAERSGQSLDALQDRLPAIATALRDISGPAHVCSARAAVPIRRNPMPS